MNILIEQVTLQISKSFSYISSISFSSQKSDLLVSRIVHLAGLTRSGFESAGNSVFPKAPTMNET